MELECDTEDLIHAVRNGEQELYAIIVQRYQQQLYVYCYHLLMQREEAEDAVQDVFIAGYEKLHLYTYGKSFSAWLYKIAYNHCLNVLNKRRRAALMNKLLGPLREKSSEDGYAHVRSKEVSAISQLALKRLSPAERSLIVLRVIEGRSYDEIGQLFPHSKSALRKKVERSKIKLKKIWMELEGDRDESESNFQAAAEREFVRGAVAPD